MTQLNEKIIQADELTIDIDYAVVSLMVEEDIDGVPDFPAIEKSWN